MQEQNKEQNKEENYNNNTRVLPQEIEKHIKIINDEILEISKDSKIKVLCGFMYKFEDGSFIDGINIQNIKNEQDIYNIFYTIIAHFLNIISGVTKNGFIDDVAILVKTLIQSFKILVSKRKNDNNKIIIPGKNLVRDKINSMLKKNKFNYK